MRMCEQVGKWFGGDVVLTANKLAFVWLAVWVSDR